MSEDIAEPLSPCKGSICLRHKSKTIDSESVEWPGEVCGFAGTLVSFSSSTEMWNTVSSRPTRFSTLVERLIERIGYIYSTIISDGRDNIRISSKPRIGEGVEHEPISAITPYWVTYSPDLGRRKLI